MLRDIRQRAAVCRALAALAGELHAWTPTGPTERAAELAGESVRVRIEQSIAPSQHLLHRLAWDLWSQTGCTRVIELMDALDEDHLRVVAELQLAIVRGGEHVDRWLEQHAPPTVRVLRPSLFAQTADHTAG